MSKHSESPSKKDESGAEDLEPITMIFAGHRGFGASQVQHQKKERLRLPENSLISIQEVMRSGAESIEFDLYLSSDGRLMAIHDNDLSINAYFIVQEENKTQRPPEQGGGFFPVGATVSFPPGHTLVSNFPADFLKRAFDISKDLPIPEDCPQQSEYLYKQIPEYTEILELVSAENARRAETGQPRIKLNVELKGPGTGTHVQKALSDFNATKEETHRIRQEEIYYMSFIQNELAVISGLTPTGAATPCPQANLILGVPTAVQYMKIGDGYSIEDSRLNHDALSENVLRLHQALAEIPERNGTGLTGVDMSLWDVSEASIDFFCRTHKLPIHIAVVPFGPDDLHSGHINPALINIELVAKAQATYLAPDQVMIVKTDNPTLLKQMISEMSVSQEPVILSVAVRTRGQQSEEQTHGKHGIKLFTKPGTQKEPPQPIIPDRSWWGEEQIIPALQRYTDSYVTGAVVSTENLDFALNDASHNLAEFGSALVPLNVNVITRELNQEANHWVGLQVLGRDSAISVNYIDPMGQPISEQVRQQILSTFGSETIINEPLQDKAIQNAKIVPMDGPPTEAPVFVCQGNDYDCGPMLTHAMIYLARDLPLPNRPLTSLESEQLGQEIRQQITGKGRQTEQAVERTTRDYAVKQAKAIGTQIQKETKAKKGTSTTAASTINRQRSGEGSGRF